MKDTITPVHKPGPAKSMHQWPVGQFKQCLDFDEEKIQINEFIDNFTYSKTHLSAGQ